MKRRDSPAARAFKKVKLLSISALKKKADKIVSLYVRNLYANALGEVECYTCEATKTVATIQCGHFISRNWSSTRYDLENLRPQCAGCNIWGRGKVNIFAEKLMRELGTKRFAALLIRGRTTHQFTKAELQALVTKYSNEVQT